MEPRIRVGVLIFKEEKLLLVKHVNPADGFTWWVPPGGGIESHETIHEAARREVHEETGLDVKPGDPVYMRQFIYEEFGQNNMDIYLTATVLGGSETMEHMYGKGNDEHFIKELGYFSKEDIQGITVFPKALQSRLWDDREEGFPKIVFLGVERDKE